MKEKNYYNVHIMIIIM